MTPPWSLLSLHTDYGALNSDPIGKIAVCSRMHDLESVGAVRFEQFGGLGICGIDLFGALHTIAPGPKDCRWRSVCRDALQRLEIALDELIRCFLA
jgi:hypothetical protein